MVHTHSKTSYDSMSKECIIIVPWLVSWLDKGHIICYICAIIYFTAALFLKTGVWELARWCL